MTATLENRHTRLDEIAKYEPGWLDGDGKAISALVIASAKDVCIAMMKAGLPQPAVFGTPKGGVSIEWLVEGNQGLVLELELLEVSGEVNCETFALFIDKIEGTDRTLDDDNMTVGQGIEFAVSTLRAAGATAKAGRA